MTIPWLAHPLTALEHHLVKDQVCDTFSLLNNIDNWPLITFYQKDRNIFKIKIVTSSKSTIWEGSACCRCHAVLVFLYKYAGHAVWQGPSMPSIPGIPVAPFQICPSCDNRGPSSNLACHAFLAYPVPLYKYACGQRTYLDIIAGIYKAVQFCWVWTVS